MLSKRRTKRFSLEAMTMNAWKRVLVVKTTRFHYGSFELVLTTSMGFHLRLHVIQKISTAKLVSVVQLLLHYMAAFASAKLAVLFKELPPILVPGGWIRMNNDASSVFVTGTLRAEIEIRHVECCREDSAAELPVLQTWTAELRCSPSTTVNELMEMITSARDLGHPKTFKDGTLEDSSARENEWMWQMMFRSSFYPYREPYVLLPKELDIVEMQPYSFDGMDKGSTEWMAPLLSLPNNVCDKNGHLRFVAYGVDSTQVLPLL
jgi:hypothetical protein